MIIDVIGFVFPNRFFSLPTVLVSSFRIAQKVSISIHLSTSRHCEKSLLALINFFTLDIVFNKHFLKLVFQQGEPVNFSLEIVSELFVGENQFFDGLIFLIDVDFLHFEGVNCSFELLDFHPQFRFI